MADEQPESTQTSRPTLVRSDDFKHLYANTVLTDSTAWDLRLIFGRFEESADGQPTNRQQVAVSIPFGVAKLMLYWVEAGILAHELETGHPVGLRENVLPPEPPPLSDEDKANPMVLRYHDELVKLRERLLASL